MKILREAAVRADLQVLATAWNAPESFVFMPDKAAISEAETLRRLADVPDELGEHHFVLLTSGSTGEPKLVIGQRERATALARLLHDAQESHEVAATVCLLPLTYCYAFVNQWLWAMVHERSLVMTDGFADPSALAESLASTENSMICLVGAQTPLFNAHFEERVFPAVSRVHFAGGRFPQEQLDAIQQRFPNATVFNNYGCAEAMPRLTLRRASDGNEAADVGPPLPGVSLKLNEQGGLVFQSAYGAVGFVDDQGFVPVTTESWIPTGDLAEEMTNGHWRILGRQGEVFKRYGEKISLSNLLRSVNAVWGHGAAFYKDLDPAGEEAHVLVLAPHADKANVREILKVLRSDFPRTHWPLRIESVGALPLLPNGKTDVLALAELGDKQELWRQRL